MRVLVACEESQTVCIAFRAKGHESYSCDLVEPSGGHPEWHILGDALEAVKGGSVTTMDGQVHAVGKWDLLIAHPPCTYLSNAGARHLYKGGILNEERLKKGIMAKDFFLRFWWSDIPKIAVENPVPSKVYCLPEYTQIIQPYQFGHPFQKKTCLWLKGLPELTPTTAIPVECCETTKRAKWFNSGGKNRQANRAKTFPGIAKAIADQWGKEKEHGIEIPAD